MRQLRALSRWVILVLALGLTSCAGAARVDVPQRAYVPRNDGTLLARYAPIFVVQTSADAYNRIGTPSARLVDGREEVYVDPDRPVIYAEHREFRTARGPYTNLIYRVHFERVPFPALTTGTNAGIFVIITLDQQKQPVLITTVHTCGCYLVFIPTNHLPPDALPRGWNAGVQSRWGEKLPGMIQLPAQFDDALRPVVFLRDRTHRIMDVRVQNIAESDWRYDAVPTGIMPLDSLERLPLDGGVTSFYETKGPRRGFVKDSRKPLEMLLMGWLALDFRVGRDKKLAPRDEMNTTLYTSLKFWRRGESDLWPFADFLRYWGWSL
jgi:hypothetical protein